jgi:N-methylhydantoinase A
LDRIGAAYGIHRLADAQLASGVRLVSVRRGLDPRRFTLLAFGGAAGLHVCEVARQVGIGRVVVPRAAAVLSAWGMLATNLRYEMIRTHIGDVRTLGDEVLRQVFGALETEARARLAGTGLVETRVDRAVDMRYGEQVFEVTVPLDGVNPDEAGLVDRIVERFHQRHEALYTYSSPAHEVVLVNARVALVGVLPSLPEEASLPEGAPAAPRTSRPIFLNEWVEVPIFNLAALAPGQRLAGPAIVESESTTLLLHAGDEAMLTRQGWLDIAVRA